MYFFNALFFSSNKIKEIHKKFGKPPKDQKKFHDNNFTLYKEIKYIKI